ncbi:MAG: hypothetical protein ACE15D_01105 [Candidatus Eisenbacteria bacterium]
MRIALGGLLLLTLLGLGGFDVVYCHGSDGHVGVKTNGSSCCPSPAACGQGAEDAASLRSAPPDAPGTCQDTPLLQGIQHAHAAALTFDAPVATILRPPAIAATAAIPLDAAPSILLHLRSTTLRI